MKNNYKIDFAANNVTVTKAFMQKATTNMASDEFTQMKQFREMGLQVIVKKTKRKAPHYATYKQIIAAISRVVDSERYLAEFESVRIASLQEPNPYQYVMRWYEETFPNHRAVPQMDENQKIINYTDVA